MSTGLEALRILVADDNQHMRSILVTMLNSFGVKTIRECRDGADALESLRYWNPVVQEAYAGPEEALARWKALNGRG